MNNEPTQPSASFDRFERISRIIADAIGHRRTGESPSVAAAKAAEWRAKRAEYQASTQPATAPTSASVSSKPARVRGG